MKLNKGLILSIIAALLIWFCVYLLFCDIVKQYEELRIKDAEIDRLVRGMTTQIFVNDPAAKTTTKEPTK
jgi:hypothetical protein